MVTPVVDCAASEAAEANRAATERRLEVFMRRTGEKGREIATESCGTRGAGDRVRVSVALLVATLGYVEPETEEVISCPTEHVTAGSPEVAKLLLLGTPEACQFRSTNQGPPWYATAALTVSANQRPVLPKPPTRLVDTATLPGSISRTS